MATIHTSYNLQIELDYIGLYSLNNLPAQEEMQGMYARHIDFNTNWDYEKLLGIVDNCLWPHIHKKINVNSITDSDIRQLVSELIRKETNFFSAPPDLSSSGLTYGFQVTVTNLDTFE